MAGKELLDEGQGFQVFSRDDKIVIEIDPSSPGVTSKSGKSKVVASSRGNMPIRLEGQTFYLGLNFYAKK